LTGFGLFTVLYLWNAGTFLIDKSLMDWSPAAAITAALSFLVAFWLIYDTVCRVFGFRENGERIVALSMIVVVAFASWLSCQLFAGRAAFLLVGAMIATSMSANVFFWIIPGQRKVVAAMTSGVAMHNTYFTLPVIFAMLSNHYSFLYTYENNWVILVMMMLAGALIRQFFVQRHGYHLGRAKNPLPFAIAGVVLLLSVIVWMRPAPSATVVVSDAPVTFAEVNAIFVQRCQSCHGEQVQMKNVRFDAPEGIRQHALGIYQQAVVTKQMPMNNATGITEVERAVIKRWYEAGAALR
jgi:uncharacterized membrane protein